MPPAFSDAARAFCFVIITIKPNAQIVAIHSRMPMVIARGGLDAWVEGQSTFEAIQSPY
jgi:putative SOS response-associated peptidase YedK